MNMQLHWIIGVIRKMWLYKFYWCNLCKVISNFKASIYFTETSLGIKIQLTRSIILDKRLDWNEVSIMSCNL